MSCVGGSGVGMVVPVSLQCIAVQCSISSTGIEEDRQDRTFLLLSWYAQTYIYIAEQDKLTIISHHQQS